jgi:hypothetical protein
MAILQQPPSSSGPITGWDLPDALPPAGTHLAVCLGVKDTFDLDRPTFDDPAIMERINVCRFAFGLIAQDGMKYMLQTREMRISAHEKANLFIFLTAWLGHPPIIGWDTSEMSGRGTQITIGHETSRKTGRIFPAIVTIAPVMDALKGQVPDTALFALPLRTEPQQPAPTPAPAEQGQLIPEQAQAPAPAPARAPAAAPVTATTATTQSIFSESNVDQGSGVNF